MKVLLAPLFLATPLFAQLDNRWLAYEKVEEAVTFAGPLVDSTHEADLAWGDLDQDGDTDLVIARKEPFITFGGRTNVLLLNEGGKLVDGTAHATASDVEGDRGFGTQTNDRDVVVADLTGDGWLDVATAVDRTAGLPKYLSHPRVYANGGAGDAGWGGLAHGDARVPQFLHFDSGLPVQPAHTCVAAGDLDADGDVDLYFGDTDILPSGGWPPPMDAPEDDCDSRLLVNGGAGFFTDGSAERVAREVLGASFTNSVAVADVDGDGRDDLVSQTSYQRPSHAFVAYQSHYDEGLFPQKHQVYEGRPYFVSTGDLNNDGRVDLVISENGLDRHVYNLPPGEEGGPPVWSEPQAFGFLHGEDDKYAGNSVVVDLDGDGWNDVVITDVDPEIADYARRTHVYHNLGNTAASRIGVLREEREKAADEGWIGAVGLTAEALGGTHDVAPIDVDGDGRLDLVLARKDGLDVWRQVDPPAAGD